MPSEIKLYEDQEEFVYYLREAIKGGNQSVLGVASTGFGKTIVSAYIARSALQRGKTVWFVCHLKNLLNQTSKAFWQLGIEHGMIASGKRRSALPAQVGTIGTLARRLDKMKAPDLLIVDEAHLAMADSWKRVVEWAKDRGSIIMGNSATPERLDGKGLGYLFDTMIEAKSMKWLIEHKRLSDYVIYAPAKTADFAGIKTRAGDYATDQLEEAVDKPVLIGDAASHWKRYASGKRTICYCVTRKHSRHVVAEFNARGIPAAHVDGETPDRELRETIRKFADGEYMVLSNVQLMTTGFDLSAQVGREVPIEACMLLRPTQSVSLYMQMVGRALRMKREPAVILDHAGCVFKHGLPDDDREWSLEGRQKGRKKREDEEAGVTVQQCLSCFHVFASGPDSCPACGNVMPRKGRPELEVVEGELQALDKDAIRRKRKREQGKARTLEDLVALGVRRGMKKPDAWSAITIAARQRRKPRPDEFKAAKEVLARIKSGDAQDNKEPF